jgi:UDP-glucose 4-epimerase
MKALVTGGAGFIGSNLVRHLISEHHEVVVLDDFSSGYRSNLSPFPDVEIIEGDIRDEAAVRKAIKGVDIVYHLAASVGNKRSIDRPLLDADINVMGTLVLLEAARNEGVRKLVVSSSAGIFGELKTLPIREDHPIEPDSPYGCSKLYMEKAALAYAKLHGLEVICLRYFNVYGPNQQFDAYGNAIPIFAHQIVREELVTIFGDGNQTRDFINVLDVVRANVMAGRAKGISGAFNIGSGGRISINALVAFLRQTAGSSCRVRYAPPRPGDVLHSQADISAARAAFGFSPTVAIEDGLREYMTWAETLYRIHPAV